ncbi:MAG: rhamnogalacturonan acetylesterase [Victivallaceae bacterium]|nr:rhamnogalacturonan acetylesterase [Victivallaceae bacterium]
MKIKKIIAVVFILTLTFNLCAENKKIRVFLIGDSIVASYSSARYPLTGWGQLLPRIFDNDVLVINCAVGGRSSKSFRDEGRWAKVLKQIKPGDYLFIQWGHNDQYPRLPKRYSDPDGAFQDNLKRYIAEAKTAGVTPILVVMPVRGWGFSKNGSYKETHIQRQKKMPAGIKKTATTYPDAVRKVGKELNMPVIDLHKQSLELLKQKKYSELVTYYLKLPAGKYPAYPKGKNDLEHFSFKGAAMLVGFIAQDIRKSNLPLVKYLKSEADVVKALQDVHGKPVTLDLSAGNIVKKYDLGSDNYKNWRKSKDPEIIIKHTVDPNGKPVLELDFNIDHKKGAYDGKYPKAWPRAYYVFKKGTVDLNDFNYLIFYAKVSSNRQKPLGTMMSVTFSSYAKAKAELGFDLGKETNKWKLMTIPVNEILVKGNSVPEKFASLNIMQLVISEKNYLDQTKLQVKVKDLALVKLKK